MAAPHRHPLRVALLALPMLGCTVDDDGGSCPPADPVAITGLGNSVHLRDEGAVPLAELPPPPGPDEAVPPRFEASPWRVVADGETVPAGQYAFAVTTTAVPAEGPRAKLRPAGFFVSEARALSCAGPGLRATQSLTGLRIVSDRAFGPGLPAGTDLASVARIDPRTGTDEGFGGGASVPQLLEFGPRAGTLRLPDWLAGSPTAPLQFAVRFDAAPEEAGAHVLSVTYEMSNGETFVLDSDPVAIGP